MARHIPTKEPMRPLREFNSQKIQILFTDIDDTLTDSGRLGAQAYASLWKLFEAGIKVVPVTGRPAGWCEMIARQWPVEAVVGENGAFYFSYKNKKMKRHFFTPPEKRREDRKNLKLIREEILNEIPGAAVASDQFCRLFDLAIDYCEDVPRLSDQKIRQIQTVFSNHGATSKVSSIHVNGWFGDFDKLKMCKTFSQKELGIDLEKNNLLAGFVGDSPNDEPMFSFFKNSFGVANVKDFAEKMKSLPTYIATKEGGLGFSEIAAIILKQN